MDDLLSRVFDLNQANYIYIRARILKYYSIRAGRRLIIKVIIENPFRIALRVVVLSRAHRPKERQETQRAQTNRRRGQEKHDVHRRNLPTLGRAAFNKTTIEDPDIARAATKGLTKPNMAAGVATTL